jgi:hypothetical protein
MQQQMAAKGTYGDTLLGWRLSFGLCPNGGGWRAGGEQLGGATCVDMHTQNMHARMMEDK